MLFKAVLHASSHLYNDGVRIVQVLLCLILTASIASAQRARKPAPSGEALAEAGQCREAIPRLKKELPRITNPERKRAAGLAGVRCAMGTNQPEEAADFIRILTRDFPQDPEVLYQAAHVYSDLSLKASQELLYQSSLLLSGTTAKR